MSKATYKGITESRIINLPLSALAPYLSVIATQQNLRLNRPREFKICADILLKSINEN